MIHFCQLQKFSADGQVYRAFGHLIAAQPGMILLAPLTAVVGKFYSLVDGCPVPWEECFAVLDYPVVERVASSERTIFLIATAISKLAKLGIDISPSQIDLIAPMVNGEEKVLRLICFSGVRFAVVMEQMNLGAGGFSPVPLE